MLLNVGEVLCGGSVPRGSPCTVSALRHRVGVPFRMVIDYHTFARLSTCFSRKCAESFRRCFCNNFAPSAAHVSACPAVTRSAVRRLASCHLLRKHDTGDGLHPDRRRRDQHRCCHYISISQLISTTHKRTGKHA